MKNKMNQNQFRTIRHALDVSQTEMAKRLGGYSIRAIQSWEDGTRKIPPAVKILMEIMEKCNIN